MPIRTVVLDFDGTCTDVEREAGGFLAAYKSDLARTIGHPDIDGAWAEKEAQVLAEPSRHGMRIGGRLVAPAVDLYLLATAVSILIEPDLDDVQTERLFKENYRFTTTAFKPEACEAISGLLAANVDLFVVTNSEPGKVGAKLDALHPAGREGIRLRGNARKFLVCRPEIHAGDARFEALEEVHEVAGWSRPILPGRGHYFDALASIWCETGTGPQDTLVIGDVFELDLVLPGLLGCRTHLVPSARTLDYERRGTKALGGSVADDLRAVLALL